MRKYIRLSLLITVLVSCVLMLVYQQKYSKLSVVLEMMNSFGCKACSANCHKQTPDIVKFPKPSWHSLETIAGVSSWTEVFPGIYTYSTFWINKRTRSLIFIKDFPISFAEELKCNLWYDNTKTGSLGKLKFELIFRKDTSFLAFVECKDNLTDKVPHGISFNYLNKSLTMMPVINSVSYLGQYSMCIEPLPAGYNNIFQVAEFLTYHHHIGIKHFVFYDKGILPKVKQLFLEIAPKYDIAVTLLPWNIPFNFQNLSQFNNEHLIDCFHRVLSRNHSEVIVHCRVDQFVVPKLKLSLKNSIIPDTQMNTGSFRLYESKFCFEYVDDIIGHNLNISFTSLLKTKSLAMLNYSAPVFFSVDKLKSVIYSGKLAMWLSTAFTRTNSILAKEIVSLHTYKACNISFKVLENHYISDKFMWKYKNVFFKSELCKFAEQQNISN